MSSQVEDFLVDWHRIVEELDLITLNGRGELQNLDVMIRPTNALSAPHRAQMTSYPLATAARISSPRAGVGTLGLPVRPTPSSDAQLFLEISG
jgi:hypothetical protein